MGWTQLIPLKDKDSSQKTLGLVTQNNCYRTAHSCLLPASREHPSAHIS